MVEVMLGDPGKGTVVEVKADVDEDVLSGCGP